MFPTSYSFSVAVNGLAPAIDTTLNVLTKLRLPANHNADSQTAMSTMTFPPLRIPQHLAQSLPARPAHQARCASALPGAIFGVLWIFLSPLIMLAIFRFYLRANFSDALAATGKRHPFLGAAFQRSHRFQHFCRDHFPCSDLGARLPQLSSKNYFPGGYFAHRTLGAALVHGGFSFLILLATLAWTGHLHASLLLFPLLIVPLLLLALGLSWFIAAWGIFLRDMTQIVPVFVQMLMFLSPVFYPISAVPESLRTLYQLNPLSTVIEATRAAVGGHPVDWSAWGMAFGFCLIAAILGYAFFHYSKDEFADAL